MKNILNGISLDSKKSKEVLKKIMKSKNFPKISFDEAVELLVKNGFDNMINFTNQGRDISSNGEIKLAELLEYETPFWIESFDRDRVPFYQKPNSNNPQKVICADLIFPPIIKNAFGGK